MPATRENHAHKRTIWRIRLTAAATTIALVSSLLASGSVAAQDPSEPQDFFDRDTTEAAIDERPKEVAATISDHVVADLAVTSLVAPASVSSLLEIHGADLELVSNAVVNAGGTVTGSVPGFFIEARVPIDAITPLADHPEIQRITRVTEASPAPLDAAFESQTQLQANAELESTILDSIGLRSWHNAGETGAGQRIGIIDLFDSDDLERAINQGRIPAPSGEFCRVGGTDCDLRFDNVGPHGVGVAEITHTAAPDAEIYLATALTLSDLSATIDWFDSQGVTIINRSQTSEFDGPGDGTGPIASLIDRAVSNGMVWVNAAGNSGGSQRFLGQNWVGNFNDPDGNGIHNWADGQERMGFTCGFLLGMRWDDWAADVIPTDYDLVIYDERNDGQPETVADDLQATLAHRPLERITTRCSGPNDRDYLSIVRYEDVGPDGSDQIQILGNFTEMDEWVNEFAATGPGADSANPGAVTVGATNSPLDSELAFYSSQGPTFDGRTAVSIAAPACLPVEGFGPCFTGTSASAPLVAGVLAVLRSAGIFNNASNARSTLALIANDNGPAGPDNLYGVGSLALPAPGVVRAAASPQLCQGAQATIVGTAGNDILVGTAGADVFVAGAGDDEITGLGGNDIICAGRGDDNIVAGQGADVVIGGDGQDRIRGGKGRDVIDGGAGPDNINGNNGRDTVLGTNGADLLRGGQGDDTLRGGQGDDTIHGGGGDDRVFGDLGSDTCPAPVEFAQGCEN